MGKVECVRGVINETRLVKRIVEVSDGYVNSMIFYLCTYLKMLLIENKNN